MRKDLPERGAAFAAKKENPLLSVCVLSKESLPEYSAPALPDYLSGEMEAVKLLVRRLKEYEEAGIEFLGGRPALHLFWEPAQRGGAAAGVNAAGGDRPYSFSENK